MNDENLEREQQIADRARRLFADSVSALDGQTRSRLARVRAAAVEGAGQGQTWFAPARLAPLGGLAAAALAVAVFWNVPGTPIEPVETVALNDLDILLEGEELDLFEDLEFYAWLLEQPDLVEQAADQDDNG